MDNRKIELDSGRLRRFKFKMSLNYYSFKNYRFSVSFDIKENAWNIMVLLNNKQLVMIKKFHYRSA